MKNISLFLIVAVLSLLSCNEDVSVTQQFQEADNTLNVEQQDYQAMSLGCDSLYDPRNPNNPYDEIGKEHNNALTYAANNMATITTTNDSMFNLVVEYIEQQGVSYEYQSHLDTTTVEDFDNHNELDTSTLANGCSIATYRDENYLISDTSHYEILSDLHNIVEGSDDVQDIIDDLILYESMLMNDQTLSSQIVDHYLHSISILRYSLKYWSEARTLTCHPYHDFVNASTSVTSSSQEVELRQIDYYRLLIDALSFIDCRKHGALGARTLDEANENCFPGAVYSSVRAYDTGFPGP